VGAGTHCWGRQTSIDETIPGWSFEAGTGSATVGGSGGDSETLLVDDTQTWFSNIVAINSIEHEILIDKYDPGSGAVPTIYYRTATTYGGIATAEWQGYVGHFTPTVGHEWIQLYLINGNLPTNGFQTEQPASANGDATEDIAAGGIIAQKFTVPTSGDGWVSISEIGGWLDCQTAVEKSIKFCIYTHDAVNDCPETIVPNSLTGVVSKSVDTKTIWDAPYGTAPILVDGQDYWLAVITDITDAIDIYFSGSSGVDSYYLGSMTFDFVEGSAWHAAAPTSAYNFELYAVYADYSSSSSSSSRSSSSSSSSRSSSSSSSSSSRSSSSSSSSSSRSSSSSSSSSSRSSSSSSSSSSKSSSSSSSSKSSSSSSSSKSSSSSSSSSSKSSSSSSSSKSSSSSSSSRSSSSSSSSANAAEVTWQDGAVEWQGGPVTW